MDSVVTALGVAAIVFAGGVLGLLLQRALPEKYTTGGPRDMIGAVSGLIMFLSALVLGLLIWTAYGVYSTQNAAIQSFAAQTLNEDVALENFGPEAEPRRAQILQGLGRTIDQMWGEHGGEDYVTRNYEATIENLRTGRAALDALQPSTDSQRAALAAAAQAHAAIAQIRLQMALALTNPISYPLLAIVVGWATGVLCGFGLMSRSNPMTFAALFVGAAAIASAIYLILDLSDPYSGLFQASPAPIERVMRDIGDRLGVE
jgi:hypothetical protein